ncbi:hypothetical protein evm_010836 [Chilo suppressalis]|nr:hypothetical protein evm_010836 [Chilo suppressalis]
MVNVVEDRQHKRWKDDLAHELATAAQIGNHAANLEEAYVQGQPFVHDRYLAAQDLAAATAQTLLRVVARGGHRYVLGLQAFEGGKDISTEITVWDGVVVSPLAPAYQETPEPMDTDDKDEDGAQDGVAA